MKERAAFGCKGDVLNGRGSLSGRRRCNS